MPIWLYGHVWVTIALVLRHPQWGPIALPLLSKLYVRLKDLVKVPPEYRWSFQTKLELGAELVEWFAALLCNLQRRLWVVVDGGYTKRPFLKRALAAGATVVGRLRKDAALRGVPPKPKVKQRGCPRKYGDRLDLARRAHHRLGWQQGEFTLYGRPTVKTYKTFLATYPPVGGPDPRGDRPRRTRLVRLVLLRFPSHGGTDSGSGGGPGHDRAGVS